MSFLDSLKAIGGETAPIRTAIDQNRNFLRAHGMAMLSGDLKGAAALGMEGSELDQAAQAKAAEETTDAAQREKYAGILRSMGMEAHAKIVEDGLAPPGEVYMDALEQMRPKAGDPYANQLVVDGKVIDRNTMEVLYGGTPEAPKLPADYMPDPSNPNGMVPRPGSDADYNRQQDALKVAQEERDRQAAGQAAAENEALTLQSAKDAVGRAIKLVGPMTAGNVMGSEWGQSIPLLGQGAANLAAEIETIESYLGLDKLMALKAASPTGASGLGNVTEKEMRLLVAQVASLRQTQSDVELQSKLLYIQNRLDEWGISAPGSGAPAVGTVEDGYVFKGGDPANPASWAPQ